MDKEKDIEKKNPLDSLMRSTIEKIQEMVDTNTIVGTPITTVDGVTLIPISKVSFGFGSGGGGYGKEKDNFGGGGAAGVKIDPVAFLTVKDGSVRMLPIAPAPSNTVDRVIDMAPDIIDKVGLFFERKKGNKEEDIDIV